MTDETEETAARQAAIALEIESYREQIAALTPAEDTPMTEATQTDEARSTAAYEAFKRDILTLALAPRYERWPHAVITGLLDMAISLMRVGLEAEPEALPVLQAQARRVLDSITPIEIPDDGPRH